jgi:RimJ/RimL family protein N-acetyltransferase
MKEVTVQNQSNSCPFLKGDRVYLRPVEPDDLAMIRKWVNDVELRGLIGSVHSMDRSGTEEWFKNLREDKNRIWFVVCLSENDRLIGEAGLLRVFYPWRTADLSLIIGEKDAWGKGYGTEAVHLLMDYAFGYLNLHRLAIGVVGFNERALRFWEKAGFKQEGIQRDGYFHGHKYSDFVMMSVLEDEYRDSS